MNMFGICLLSAISCLVLGVIAGILAHSAWFGATTWLISNIVVYLIIGRWLWPRT